MNKDVYWNGVMNSDIRNILPKYEVCKIQLSKNNIQKIRLILQNMNRFILLQVQKKNIKNELIDLNENIMNEL